jgi:hypothetical protein
MVDYWAWTAPPWNAYIRRPRRARVCDAPRFVAKMPLGLLFNLIKTIHTSYCF